MKKKTVITTEKREVWVIHQLPGDAAEHAQNIETEVLRNVPDLVPQREIQSDLPKEDEE